MNAPSPQAGQQTLQTVERALAFLEHVGGCETPPTVKDVSLALGLNITTCYHLMRTLLHRGYLHREPGGTLVLGPAVRDLHQAFQRTFNVDEQQTVLVGRLAKVTAETAYLSVREGPRVVLKVLVEGSQALRVSGLHLGLSGREHVRASGKAVLAFLPAPEREAMLESALQSEREDQREPIRRALEYELDATRSRGWSLDDQGSDVGISSLGVPVFGPGGEVYGAIGVVVPAIRMQGGRTEFVSAARTTAEAMAALLGGSPRAGEPPETP